MVKECTGFRKRLVTFIAQSIIRIIHQLNKRIMKPPYSFSKKRKADKVYWAETLDSLGEFIFSFDQVKVYIK